MHTMNQKEMPKLLAKQISLFIDSFSICTSKSNLRCAGGSASNKSIAHTYLLMYCHVSINISKMYQF